MLELAADVAVAVDVGAVDVPVPVAVAVAICSASTARPRSASRLETPLLLPAEVEAPVDRVVLASEVDLKLTLSTGGMDVDMASVDLASLLLLLLLLSAVGPAAAAVPAVEFLRASRPVAEASRPPIPTPTPIAVDLALLEVPGLILPEW